MVYEAQLDDRADDVSTMVTVVLEREQAELKWKVVARLPANPTGKVHQVVVSQKQGGSERRPPSRMYSASYYGSADAEQLLALCGDVQV